MSTVSETPVTIKARYPSKCQRCSKWIAPGEMIQVHHQGPEKKRWVHAECPNGHPAPGLPIGPEMKEVLETTVRVVNRLDERVTGLEKVTETLVAEIAQRSVQVIEIRHPDGNTVQIDGAVHPVFAAVVQLANARKHIFLPGPAGCGKSHMAGQVAEALGLRFGFISCSAGMSESQLLGRTIPAGDHGQFEFQPTQFLECYEDGGVFLFDEIDAADANVLLVINSALANGHLSVPSRHGNPVAKRHADFVCIAAANTYGRGADRQYVGRSELDESTLDRFRIGTVPMDYDEGLEQKLCPDETLYSRLRTYRERIRENRLERIVSTRFIKEAHEMVSQWGWTYDQVDSKLFAGWRRDEIAKVNPSN
jgi:cobaltochelatase CobS